MSDMSNFDPTTMATNLAGYDILALKNSLASKSSTLEAQKKALSALRDALSGFRTAITGLNSSSASVLKNIATMNQEGVATVTTNSSARKGTYTLNVQQLASAQQKSFDGLTDEAIKSAKGTLKINLNGKSVDIDMDGLNSLADFADAINKAEFPDGAGSSASAKDGVTASLMRIDGKVTLMMSSDQSGEKYNIQLDTSGMTSGQDIFKGEKVVTAGQDAKFTIGDDSTVHSSSSNTLDNLADGVTIQLTGTTQKDKPLIISVGTDEKGTHDQMQAFVDAYNKLQETISGLTASGGKSDARGAFAGDASVSSLSNELSNMLRGTFGGQDMTKFGITADKDGKLTIDNDTLNAQLKADPQAVSDFFNGSKGLIKTMDKSLDKYLNASTGLLKGRQDTLDREQRDIDDKTDKMNTRYESSFNRYLKQFTQLQSVMTQMNNTMSMFG